MTRHLRRLFLALVVVLIDLPIITALSFAIKEGR